MAYCVKAFENLFYLCVLWKRASGSPVPQKNVLWILHPLKLQIRTNHTTVPFLFGTHHCFACERCRRWIFEPDPLTKATGAAGRPFLRDTGRGSERTNVTEAVKRHTCGCGGNRANGIGKRDRVLSDPICKPFFRGKRGNLQALCRPFPIFAYTWRLVCIMEPICYSIKCD